MITLPPARRASLLSFWLAISLSAGLLISVLASVLLSPQSFLLGVGVALVLALPGCFWPQAMLLPYRVWNRLARDFAHYASLLLMGICFYIIFVAVGRAGSSLRLARPTATQSLWVPRKTLAPTTYGNQHAIATEGSLKKGQIASLFSWALHSGNLWTCCLLPFLILLSLFETEQENSVPAGIYTLF